MACESAPIQRHACIDQRKVRGVATQIVDHHGMPCYSQSFVHEADDFARFKMMREQRTADTVDTRIREGKLECIARDPGKAIRKMRWRAVQKYGLKLEPHFRCDFRDPWGNRIQVGDLSDESLVWLLPYREVQTTGITFAE